MILKKCDLGLKKSDLDLEIGHQILTTKVAVIKSQNLDFLLQHPLIYTQDQRFVFLSHF